MQSFRHNRTLTVIRKEFLQIIRDRGTLVVVLLQPIMMLFSNTGFQRREPRRDRRDRLEPHAGIHAISFAA